MTQSGPVIASLYRPTVHASLDGYRPVPLCDFGLAILGEQVIESLGEEILNRGIAIGSQNTQLLLHSWMKITGDVALALPAWPKVKVLRRGG
jgi:hypothetical protein